MKFINLFRCGPLSASKQTWRIMKMTIFIITAFLIQVSASTNAQQVTLAAKNINLKQAFSKIRHQTGYNILYNSAQLKNSKPVTLNLQNASLEQALAAVLKDQNLQYTIQNKAIIISEKQKPSFLETLVDAFTPPVDLRGKILDENGNPLPGVTIRVKNGNQTVTTNTDGSFYLPNVDDKATILITYIGYKPIEKPATSDFTNISMEVTTGELQEITINKGYYTTTRELNTGNVSVVNNKDIIKSGLGDPIAALNGQVPGLFIVQTNGLAGGAVGVQMRGTNSISNGNDPLYIIDGIPFNSQTLTTGNGGGAALKLSPFSGLNPDNIERIEVLKDADATAIYGSRGANGVILISTKKGEAGKTSFNVNVYSGAGDVARKLDLMNTEEYIKMRRMALSNDGVTTPSTDPDLNGDYGNINKYTDWQKVFIGGTAHITDANVSISGGSDKTSFLLGGGYRRETDLFPGNFADRKASFNANVNHNDGKFHTNFSVSYLNDNNRMSPVDFTGKILLSPNAPDLFTQDGKLNWQNQDWENPIWETTQRTVTLTETINSSLTLGYEWINGLSTTVRTGYNSGRTHFNVINPFVDYRPDFEVTPEYRSNLYGDNKVNTWSIEPSASYTQMLGNGKLETLLGGTFQQTDNNGINGSAYGFASPEMIENIAIGTYQFIDGYIDTRYRYSAIYARAAYNYKERYLINLTGRRDASSRFGPGKQFANLGAIGVAWIFSREKSIAEVLPFLSFGKVRSSYGITGNDQLRDYEYLSLYQSTGSVVYQTYGGLVPRSLTNPVYGWETVKKLEAGLELGFIDDRILFNASWYRNRTGNQLVGYALPSITGFTSVRANLPAVIQNTGLEFDFTARILKQSPLQWTLSGNLTIPKNKLISYPNIENSSYASTYIVGQPLYIQFRYSYLGMDRAKQIYTFEDRNGDGQISGQADYVPVFVGQKYYGGLNNSFVFKGFQLDVFFQFVKQNGTKYSYTTPGQFNSQFANQLSNLLQKEEAGEISKFTQQYGSESANSYANYVNSTGMLQDASFIRLKNVSLSWTLPKKVQETLKLRNCNVYMRGQNLLTFTNFQGLDPENSAGQLRLPPLRTILFGIQLSL